MDARKAQITDIFNNSTLVEVPFFQRQYVWQDDLWNRFLEDMEYVSKTRKPHFLGSIILKEGKRPGDEDQFSQRKAIVDGQQRLTTFLIFLKVLCLKQGQSIFFDIQFRINGQEIALRHGKNDIEAFERVMSTSEAVELSNPAPQSRIIEAYNYFVRNINASCLNIMVIRSFAQFVLIDLNADEDEQQIFDTINSLGVNLTTSELLKNYFFNRDTVAEYEEKWVSVFEKDEETKAYWDQQIEVGRTKRAMIDIFFDSFFQLFIQDRRYNISNEDKLMYARVDKLAQSYQHFINTYCNGDKSHVLRYLKDYAYCYMQCFRPEYCDMNIPAAYGIERLNVIIFGLKNTTLIPYVLYIAKNITDETELNQMYALLESYVMRRIVVHASTKNYNNLFTSLMLNRVLDSNTLFSRLTATNEATTYIPDNEELHNGFKTSKLVNLQSKGILYLIESRIRPSNASTVLLGFNNYSLEHLMPKKWRNNWPSCATSAEADKRDSLLLTLGNLAIIPQSLNASIRDSNWQTKKSGKGTNKPGLDICAAGLITVHDALQKSAWTEEDILERAAWLAKRAEVIWHMEPAQTSTSQVSQFSEMSHNSDPVEPPTVTEDLIRQFDCAMKEVYLKAKRECGYNATRFLQMISEQGGLATAKKLIAKPGGTDGFTTLWEHHRLDISVEAIVLKPEFAPLFTQEERKLCRERLTQFNYFDKR